MTHNTCHRGTCQQKDMDQVARGKRFTFKTVVLYKCIDIMASQAPNSPQPPAAGARRLIARNFVSLSIGQVVVLVIGFVTSIYSRRVLGATAIGEVAWSASVLSYFTLVINPGLDTIAQTIITSISVNPCERTLLYRFS